MRINYRNLILMSLIIFSLINIWETPVSADFWHSYSTLKLTIETDEILYEWEYENPNSFEYEIENRIYRGDMAKESFEEILALFDLAGVNIGNKEISLLENKGLKDINRIVIQMRDRDYELKTLVWINE